MSTTAAICRRGVTVTGVVQGVGFRPFVYNAAVAESLGGWVANDSGSVVLEVQGAADAIERFLRRLLSGAPAASKVESVRVSEMAPLPPEPEGAAFEIRVSDATAEPAPVIPADLRVCPDCLADTRNPDDRRHGYAFTNCTHCGPRWSIVEGVPYDRPNTAMRGFAMCPECQAEYDDPTDRRFHAQPVACPRCGPRLRLINAVGDEAAPGEDPLEAAAAAVLAGRIVGVKGLGGFQLVCDATNEQAVVELRHRKGRPDKPLAILVATADEARHLCEFTAVEEAEWLSSAGPILLLHRREGDRVAPSVAPRSRWLGVLAPTTPLHHLLLARIGRPIVCTSGNRSDEPMAIDDADAIARLGRVADLFLTHNRPIVRAVDDSVARADDGGLRLLRRARGYAPAPVRLGATVDGVLAVGARLKNVVGVGVGEQLVLSPHLGDLEHQLTVDLHRRTLDDLTAFYRVTPRLVVCDAHPDYESTHHAEALAQRYGAPLLRVQHHHAHVASVAAEHGLEGPLAGLAWDGAGYGDDGAVWGGETLVVEGAGFLRAGRLRTFPLLGGDRAARDPALPALGLLHAIDPQLAAEQAARWRGDAAGALHCHALRSERLTQTCSSMGRLFDGVAALAGVRGVSSYEGQAAAELESLADRCQTNPEPYPFPVVGASTAVADWEPLVRAVLSDVARGRPAVEIAAAFHGACAAMAAAMAQAVGVERVALTGGCFQNHLLTDQTVAALHRAGFEVFENRQVPPGDGGIALGQAWVAAQKLLEDSPCA